VVHVPQPLVQISPKRYWGILNAQYSNASTMLRVMAGRWRRLVYLEQEYYFASFLVLALAE
jgi:hypothetical protein